MTLGLVRLSVAGTICLICATTAPSQERGPGGAIYNELLPFVGLDGVRFRVDCTCGGGVIYNVFPQVDDPEKRATGFTAAENRALFEATRSKVAEVLRQNGIPVLVESTHHDLRPELVISVSWSLREADRVEFRINTEFREAANRIREPRQTMWARSWGLESEGPTTRAKLSDLVLNSVRIDTERFAELYKRAHAR